MIAAAHAAVRHAPPAMLSLPCYITANPRIGEHFEAAGGFVSAHVSLTAHVSCYRASSPISSSLLSSALLLPLSSATLMCEHPQHLEAMIRPAQAGRKY